MFLKFLIILILVCYVFYRVGGFLFKMLFLGATERYKYSTQDQEYKKPPRSARDSNLNIDYVPKKEKETDKPDRFQGGDYVDFEEVK